MNQRADFETQCERVSRERGWGIEPKGIRIPCEDERSQLVEFAFLEESGRARVRLYSRIGSRSLIDPAVLPTALDLNFKLPHGAFAVNGDQLVLTETLPLDTLQAEDIAAALLYLATTADHYEQTIFGPDEH
ncbi:YbjN domain-containing protein [Myxococcota bacterium]|nr:YbjN domain-containing protein [Myxococcota bacterium]